MKETRAQRMMEQAWNRQADMTRRVDEERLYQISQLPKDDPTQRPEVVATCQRSSAQRLISALSEQEDSAYRYRVTGVFVHPVFPGMDLER